MFFAVFFGVLVIIIVIAGCTGIAETAFYVPSRERFATPRGYEDISFTNPDGLKLHAWLILPSDYKPGTRIPAVLHVHGNAGNVSSHEGFSNFIPNGGIAVLIFDYRSYGRSNLATKRLARDQLMADTRAAYACLRSRPEIDPERIGVFGVSLGATFASTLAAETPEIKSLCLVSAFSTWQSVANDHAPILGGLLVSSGLDPARDVALLGTRPLLLVHGKRDDIVAFKHSESILAAAKGAGVPAELVPIANAGHNDITEVGNEAPNSITAFFVKTLGR